MSELTNPTVECTTTDRPTAKRPKEEETIDSNKKFKEEIGAWKSKLTGKQFKKYAKARKNGFSVSFDEENNMPTQILHPQVFFEPVGKYTTMKEIRSLLLGLLKKGSTMPKGIRALGDGKIPKVVLLDCPMLDPSDLGVSLGEYYISPTNTLDVYNSLMQHKISKYLGHKLGENVLASMTTVGLDTHKYFADRFLDIIQSPLSKEEIKKIRNPNDQFLENRTTTDFLMLDYDQLVSEGYPIPAILDNSSELPEGWVDTPIGSGDGREKRLMALDCEMCRTANGLAITSIALVNAEGESVLRCHVKPAEKIIDYLTKYSGVDETCLRDVKTTLSDIQTELLKHIDGDVVLIGHGLNNDLNCLQIRHPYIIDTSTIYHHTNGPPAKPSLRFLAHRWLKRQIQEKSKNNGGSAYSQQGHDPCEDAIASLDLVKKKLKYGPEYGLHPMWISETIIDMFERHQLQCSVVQINPTYTPSFTSKLREKKTYFTVTTNTQLAEKVIEQHAMGDAVVAEFQLPAQEEDKNEVMVNCLEMIYDALEPDTALVLLCGNRTNTELDSLIKRNSLYKQALAVQPLEEIPMEDRWTLEDEQNLTTVTDTYRRGLLFAMVKNVV
ncbi:hypothetical protein BDF14DRAFT_1885454 [Spinellus fusiger]|nr:hypothetical protein BDF14DRAFT_1885454 [Spinellus fusiger]